MDLLSSMEAFGTSDIALLAAFFIGLMMAISPCPLAQNITAIAYISRKIDDSRHTIAVGLLYTIGRMTSYIAIASGIVLLGLNIQAIALPLQQYADLILGPILIFFGLIMIEAFHVVLPKTGNRLREVNERLAERGYLGSFLLGVVFSLTFCPFSAVLFFGMLIPLALRVGDAFFVPAVFAFATGLPVILFSVVLVYSVFHVATMMNKIQIVEKWTRMVVGVLFIAVGVYYTVTAFFPIW